jgi:hypothetical protein
MHFVLCQDATVAARRLFVSSHAARAQSQSGVFSLIQTGQCSVIYDHFVIADQAANCRTKYFKFNIPIAQVLL